MIRKALVVVMALVLAVSITGIVLYRGNRAPQVPPVAAADAAQAGKPFVVKLHAQWCPLCMITKEVWREVETTYAGRVNLVVLDFTNDETTAVSRAEARRLGLERFLSDYDGATGIVAVVDGRTGEVLSSIRGSRDIGEYRSAIDAALEGATSSPAGR